VPIRSPQYLHRDPLKLVEDGVVPAYIRVVFGGAVSRLPLQCSQWLEAAGSRLTFPLNSVCMLAVYPRYIFCILLAHGALTLPADQSASQ
jgi:hypothetical protein